MEAQGKLQPTLAGWWMGCVSLPIFQFLLFCWYFRLFIWAFDRKWLHGGAPADEPLVGSADIQSLADLGNSFEVVKGMSPVPFTKQTALRLALTTLAPTAPLILTVIPLSELLGRLLKVIF